MGFWRTTAGEPAGLPFDTSRLPAARSLRAPFRPAGGHLVVRRSVGRPREQVPHPLAFHPQSLGPEKDDTGAYQRFIVLLDRGGQVVPVTFVSSN
jgi:hypothetical protein